MLLRYNASTSLLCEGLTPCDVVAVDALETRQRGTMRLRSPSTLNAVETSVADRICGILRRASSWRRWGWLVVMRARHLGTEQVLGTSMSSSLLSSTPTNALLSSTPSNEGQGACLHDGLVTQSIGHDCSPLTAGWSTSAAPHVTPKCATSPGVHGQEPMKFSGPDNMTGARGCGWKGAGVWLLQCPDECGGFREVLSFL